MEDKTVDLHTAITVGIDRALRDMGADLSGCTPSMLTGHVIKELRAAGLHPSPPQPAMVRAFRYTKANGPVYRAYPDGRVTRNDEDVDPSNLNYCVASVRKGAMMETKEDAG
jgi:hypothetical protein